MGQVLVRQVQALLAWSAATTGTRPVHFQSLHWSESSDEAGDLVVPDVARMGVSRENCDVSDVTEHVVEGGGCQGFREVVAVVAAVENHPRNRESVTGAVAKMEGTARA